MTKLALPAGVTPLLGSRRLNSPNMAVGLAAASGVTSATSVRATATATASGTPHTVGTYANLGVATTDAVGWLELTLLANTTASATVTSMLLNIGVDTTGGTSYTTVVPGLQVGWGTGGPGTAGSHWRIPIHVPVGSRVGIQNQAAVASATCKIAAVFGAPINGKQSPTALDALGQNLATSRGVDLAAPGSTNTKTAYTTIVASTTQPYGALVVGIGGAATNAQPASDALVDIAVGAAASEVIIIPDIYYTNSISEQIACVGTPLYPCNIPAGARISARFASSQTSLRYDMSLLGVPRQ